MPLLGRSGGQWLLYTKTPRVGSRGRAGGRAWIQTGIADGARYVRHMKMPVRRSAVAMREWSLGGSVRVGRRCL